MFVEKSKRDGHTIIVWGFWVFSLSHGSFTLKIWRFEEEKVACEEGRREKDKCRLYISHPRLNETNYVLLDVDVEAPNLSQRTRVMSLSSFLWMATMYVEIPTSGLLVSA